MFFQTKGVWTLQLTGAADVQIVSSSHDKKFVVGEPVI